ncbi:MAG TPA: LysR family transcriptional regulator [Chthoniobacterales bacterium]|nr:LysR family transcriptional regulator [Chthoniobacterales bacterium]
MEIHQLRYFVAVAEERSFSRAAAREHVAQPSLSQQIQKLEAEMDQRLFDRLSRTVVVTEAGKCLLEYARKILVEIAEARRCLDDLKQEVAGRLSIGAILTMAPYVLPKLIGKFQAHYPKVEVEVLEDTTESLALRLEDGTLDIAIMSTCQQSPALEPRRLGDEPLLVLLPKRHRLAKKKNIEWSDLEPEKFLLLHEVHCLSAQVCELLAAHDLRPELALRGAQLATIAGMVATGLGVSFVPQMMVEHHLPAGCVALPLTPPAPVRELNLLRNPLRLQTRAATAFYKEAAGAISG